MKKLLLLATCLVAFASSPVLAQTSGPDIVVVRVTEDYRHIYVSVTRGEGKSEQLKFDSGAVGAGLDASGQGYYRVLKGLYEEGYHLQSTFGATVSASDSRATLLFVKGQ